MTSGGRNTTSGSRVKATGSPGWSNTCWTSHRWKTDGKEYRFERLDTARWLRAVVDEAAAPGVSGATMIVVRIPDTLPPIEVDASALTCALHNLIDNAVKYSPGRDAVWVEAAARNGTVSIRVRDEGVGISEQDRRRIFEKFYRAQGDLRGR